MTHQLGKRLAGLILGMSPLWLGTGLVAAQVDPMGQSSVGQNGIDALRLHRDPYNLTGRKIAIGQVEIGRPGRFGLDKEISPNWAILPIQVFFRDTPARSNNGVDEHAHNVASVMISAAKAAPGVAPGARLFSSAAGKPKRSGQREECLAAQHVALQNGGDVRSINFSFGESLEYDPRPNPVLDGNALLTQCVDWSARVHNVVYVVAGNQGRGGIPIPTDNFNGINVAFTMRVKDVFTKLDFANLGDSSPLLVARYSGRESNTGARRSIGLVAPGAEVPLVNPDGSITRSSGTSFAAPHVTAAVALLQEYGDRQLATSCTPACKLPWTLDARQQEVMRAVLLNSADKVEDGGDGSLLGMSRTIVDKSNRNWLASDAYRDTKIPVDIQMGTGQLNAYRAYQQFSPGQWNPEAPVPAIGWDYRTFPRETAKQASQSQPFQEYVLEQPLQAGSFVSITLAWNRVVDLVDENGNKAYDIGEEFRDRGLNNLDLYLMRAEDTDPRDAIWSSISDVDSLEHIFYQIPQTGRYKVRVQFREQVNPLPQPYALAWWTKPVSP